MTRTSIEQASSGDVLERAVLVTTRVVVALVFLTPLVVMADPLPPTFFPFVVGKAVYARTMIEISLGLWLVLFLRSSAYRVRGSWLIPILGAYVFVVLLASVLGVSPQRSIWSTYERMQGFVDIAHWLAFVVVLTSVYRSWNDWRVLLNMNLGISCIIGLVGLGQYFDVKVFSYLSDAKRIDISFGNATYVGVYMLVNVTIGLGLLARSLAAPGRPVAVPNRAMRGRDRRRRRARGRAQRENEAVSAETLWRAFWIFAVVLDGLIMLLSGTRGAVIGLGAGLVSLAIAYLAWGRLGGVRLAAMVLLGSVVGLIVLVAAVRDTEAFQKVASTNYLLSRIAKIGPGDRALVERLSAASVGLQAFAARPLLGWGPENFTIGFDRHVSAEIVGGGRVVSFDQAHNKLIEELTTKGLLGFLLYMTTWAYMMWVLARKIPALAAHDQLLVLFVGAGLIGYFVQNLFLFDTPGTVTQYFLLMGFVVYLDSAPGAAALATAAGGPASDSSEKEALDELRLLKTDSSMAIALFVSGVMVLVALTFINLAPLKGSRTILQTLNPQISWSDRLAFFGETTKASPPLANYPRIVMFNQLTNNWTNLSRADQLLALETVDREAEIALKVEPQEWRLQFSLATLYQRAASTDPEYLDRARQLVEETERLAPNRIETHRLIALQFMAENDFDAAQEAIDSYLSKNPEAARHFNAIQNEIDRAAQNDS